MRHITLSLEEGRRLSEYFLTQTINACMVKHFFPEIKPTLHSTEFRIHRQKHNFRCFDFSFKQFLKNSVLGLKQAIFIFWILMVLKIFWDIFIAKRLFLQTLSKHSFELETWVKQKTPYFVLVNLLSFFLKWEAVLKVFFSKRFLPKLSSLVKHYFCIFLLKKKNPVILVCLFCESQAFSENWFLVYTLRNPLVCCLNLGFITGNPTSQNFPMRHWALQFVFA